MHSRRHELILFSLISLLAAFASACSNVSGPPAEEVVDWGYKGEIGPDYWGELHPDFSLCAEGKKQSPIEIGIVDEVDETELFVHWQKTDLNLIHDGHTVKLLYTPGSYVEFEGTRYDLEHIHFHEISEHKLDGLKFPMEMHLVHKSAKGKPLMVASFIKFGDINMEFNKLSIFLPTEPGEETYFPGVKFDVAHLMRFGLGKAFFHYEGSLTEPPCTEGVHWFVAKPIVHAHLRAIYTFREALKRNERPLQALNDREIKKIKIKR